MFFGSRDKTVMPTWVIAHARTGVGTFRSNSRDGMPLAAITRAVSDANTLLFRRAS